MAEKFIYDSKYNERLSQDISDDELDDVFNALVAKAAKNKPTLKPQSSIVDKVTALTDTQEAMNRSFTEWMQILAPECGVYNTKYGYLAKECDDIAYKYIGRDDDSAKDIVRHNLTAILRYKYFKTLDDTVHKRIREIVQWFCADVYNNICYMTINRDDPVRGSLRRDTIPASAVAFANGVYDFKENRWLIKYERIKVPDIKNTIILYPKYAVMWYFNYDFEPYDFSIEDVSFEEFCSAMKGVPAGDENLTWQLFYNMTHDAGHKESARRRQHFAEILGYTLMAPFVQAFVILVGTGHNGKNSIFDGAFSNFVIPAPGQESFDNIENDKFIGGTLKGLSHNISLETKPGVYKTSDQLKKLTGSDEFASEDKGKRKETIPLNCRFIFSANDQNNLKFGDHTTGFERRCNLFEIYYHWDKNHEYLNMASDYYKTEFQLDDIRRYTNNNKLFVYLGMYGIMSATQNFTKEFSFTYNEWSETYSDKDLEVESFFRNELTAEDLFKRWNDPCMNVSNSVHQEAFMIEDNSGAVKGGATKLISSNDVQSFCPCNTWQELAKQFKSFDTLTDYDADGNEIHAIEMKGITFLRDHDLYVSLEYLRSLMKIAQPYAVKDNGYKFNEIFRKALNIRKTLRLAQNKAYVRIRLRGTKVDFLNEN